MAITGTLQHNGVALYPRTLASQIAGLTAFLDEWYKTKGGTTPSEAETYSEVEPLITDYLSEEETIDVNNLTVGGDVTVATLNNNVINDNDDNNAGGDNNNG